VAFFGIEWHSSHKYGIFFMFKLLKNLKKKLGIRFWIILGLLAILFVRVVFGGGKVAKVESTKVTKGDLVQSVSTSGTVKADNYANLTFQAGGKVVWVGVKAGQKVFRGQAIAKLDTVPLNASYQQALNNYRSAQAAVDNTLDSLKGHDSDETFSQKATRTAAEVARDNAYEALKIAESNLRNATLFAPFSGIIASANPVFAGINVTPATASYVILDPSTVYFDSEIEETDLPNISESLKVEIKLDAYPEETFIGKVVNVGIVAFTSSTGGNAYSVRISLPKNKDLKFRYGMQGDVEIIFKTIPDVLKIPSSALVSDNGKNYVWVSDNGKAKKIEVETGAESSDEIEIKSGLSEGQEIIDSPASSLKSGQKLSI
jgi:RND family efflux transporter MFP subunit